MPETTDAAEWQRIVEAQQREIEALRLQVRAAATGAVDATTSSDDGNSRPLSALSPLSSELSAPLSCTSRLDGDGERVDVDRDRFEALCHKLQRVRSKLVKRDVQTRTARAQITALQQQLQSISTKRAELTAQVSALVLDLHRESSAKEQAIEKAALALMQSDMLKAQVERFDARAIAESLVFESKAQELQRAVGTLEQENAGQKEEIAALASERHTLSLRLQAVAESERACGGQCANVRQQLQVTQDEVTRLTRALELQTCRTATQQQTVHALAVEKSQLRLDLETARDEHAVHAAHLLQTSLVLDQQLKASKRSEEEAKQRVREHDEQCAMAAEELELLRLKDELRQNQLHAYSEDYAMLLASYRDLVRASSGMELSRRDLRSDLVNTRKKVVVLHRALETLDAGIQKLSKVVATNRSRSVADTECTLSGSPSCDYR